MLWLLDNYFLPTLSPLVSTAPSVPSTPISPLLKQYKTLLKQITRDASLRSRSKPEMEKLLRDIERWIGEVKIGYSKASSWHAEDEEASERWAMDALCEGLLANGILPKK
jgi:ribosomal biogenesis protein LAS1